MDYSSLNTVPIPMPNASRQQDVQQQPSSLSSSFANLAPGRSDDNTTKGSDSNVLRDAPAISPRSPSTDSSHSARAVPFAEPATSTEPSYLSSTTTQSAANATFASAIDSSLLTVLRQEAANDSRLTSTESPRRGSEIADVEEGDDRPLVVSAPSRSPLPEHLLPSAAGTRTRNLLGGLTSSARLLKNEVRPRYHQSRNRIILMKEFCWLFSSLSTKSWVSISFFWTWRFEPRVIMCFVSNWSILMSAPDILYVGDIN